MHSKILRRIIYIFLLLFIIWWRINSIYEFPKLTGQYSVGTVSYYFKDVNRKEMHSLDGNDKRELLVQFWYPSQIEKHKAKMPYIFDSIPLLRREARNACAYYVPYFIFDCFITKVYTHSFFDAPISSDQSSYPVIIFSHGFGSLSNFNTSQVEELASHGYIVVGINHTYDCSLTIFPDGRIVTLNKKWEKSEVQYLNNSINLWIQDVSFVLNQLERVNENDPLKKFVGKLDFSKVGILGHSMGGATAAQACRLDQRIKAGINMDGPLFGKNATKGFDKPFMFLLAEETLQMSKRPFTEQELSYRKMTKGDEKTVKHLYSDNIPILCGNIKNDVYCVLLKGAGHYTFSDMPLLRKMSLILRYFNFNLVGTIEPYKAIKITNSYVLEFFNKYLKQEKSPLLDELRADPEVSVKKWQVKNLIKKIA